jgi:hypothetical protein
LTGGQNTNGQHREATASRGGEAAACGDRGLCVHAGTLARTKAYSQARGRTLKRGTTTGKVRNRHPASARNGKE